MKLENFFVWQEWLNPHNKRGWLVLAALIYSLLGFLLVPWLIKDQLPELSEQFIKRTASIEKAAFNPWTLSLRAEGLIVADSGQPTLAEADSLLINFQLRSIFQLALVFGDIELQNPRLHLTRYDADSSNISRLLDDLSADAETDSAETGTPLKLVIDSLVINGGEARLSDLLPAEPFSTTLGPININLVNLSTLPDDSGKQQVSVRAENGAKLSWSGNLTLNPLSSEGQLNLSGSPLPLLYRYLSERLAFDLKNCCLDIQLNYSVDMQSEGGINARIDNLGLSLRELTLSEQNSGNEIFNLPELSISGGSLKWPEALARIEELRLDAPAAALWLTPDGQLNLLQMLVADTSTDNEATVSNDSVEALPAPETSEPDDEDNWHLSLGSLKLDNMQLSFADRRLEDSTAVKLTAINMSVSELSNLAGQKSPLRLDAALDSGGKLLAEGEISLMPALELQSRLELSEIDLRILQPWIDQAASASLDSGVLDLSADIRSSAQETLAAQANVAVTGLNISDTMISEPLVSWAKLEFQQIEYALDSATLDISRINLSEPFARLKIDEQGATNFQSLMKPSAAPADSPQEPESPATPVHVQIGETNISQGSVNFTDLALPLPFSVLVSEFGGTISTFDSNSKQGSTLDFEGKVGEYGLSTIEGEIDLLDPTAKAQVTALFRNISMPDITPYTVEFVGQKIQSGKLDLDLNYRLEDQLIRGDNKVVLKQFKLGDRVEHPGAMNLPLGLAVGLLRDVNGVINMSLEVKGDLDDPSFSASGIILKAFANLITKAVAAPFKLLGALVPGLGGENSNLIAFAPGEARLTPPEQEKLALIAEALQQRPALILNLYTGFDPELDTAGLQKQLAATLLTQELGDSEKNAEQLIARQKKALEKLLRANNALGDLPLKDLRQQFTDADSGELDLVAYIAEMKQRLANVQVINTGQLQSLADTRLANMLAQLQDAGLDSSRLRTPDSGGKIKVDDQQITIEMGLEAD